MSAPLSHNRRRVAPPLPGQFRRLVNACPATVGGGRSGQAMLESFLVILVVCLLLFGLIQVAVVYNAREVLHHAAARAARARTVGFNAWMVDKSLRVAAIPNSGPLLEPEVEPPLPLLDPLRSPGANWDRALNTRRPLPRSQRTMIERARIPEYLASDNHLRGEYVLDYQEWRNHGFSVTEHGGSSGTSGRADTIRMTVRQLFPMELPMHRLFYAPPVDGDGISRISLSGESEIVEHFPLYLQERNW